MKSIGAKLRAVVEMLEAASKALFFDQVKGLTPRLAQSRSWKFHRINFPIIDCEFKSDGGTSMRIRMECDDWNSEPPSIHLLSSSGLHLGPSEIPRRKTNVFHQGPHNITKKPFICMRGSKEYHTHPSHISDSWDLVRGKDGYSLSEILTQIWNAWKKDVLPC